MKSSLAFGTAVLSVVLFPENIAAFECLPPAANRMEPFYGSSIGSCMIFGMKSLSLKNRSDIRIVFKLKAAPGNWADFTLSERSSEEVFCTSCTGFEISVPSEDRDTQYRLDIGKRYAIYWNNEIKAWDVVEAVD